MIIKHIKKDSTLTTLEILIYEDDPLDVIKYKMSQYLSCDIDDIYLFAQQNRNVTVHTIYEEMMKKTDKIVQHDIEHILEDLSMSHLIKNIHPKKSYSYDDLLELIDIPLLTEIPIYIPIGHVLRECVNPLQCKQKMPFNRFNYIHSNDISNDLQKTLLLEYLPFIDNVLYVVDSKQITDETIRNSYFIPIDPKPNVDEITKFIDEKNKLHSYFRDLPITSKIQTIKFTILPTHNVHISAESIFNLLHADSTNKMIQYYTGETILYKLYTIHKDKYNYKIPELNVGYIDQEGDKDNIKIKSVYIYSNDRDHLIILYENGSIVVQLRKVKKPIILNELNNEINKILLPILDTIREPIYQSGYMYPWTEKSNILTTNSFNIKINSLNYIVDFGLSINLKHKQNMKHITSVITDLSHNDDGKIIYNYVSEFNKNNLYNFVVKYLSIKLQTKTRIVEQIKLIFNISQEEALKVYSDNIIVNEQPNQQIITSGFNGILHAHYFLIEDITNIHYLDHINNNLKCVAAILNLDEIIDKKQITEIEEPIPPRLPTPIKASDIELVEDDEMGGGSNELKLKNTNFAVSRLQTMYEKLRKDYVSKCPTAFVPIIIDKKEWESDKYSDYRKRIETLEHSDKYFLEKEDHVILCPKYWSFKKRKAYVDKDDIEQPFDESKDLLSYVKSKDVKEINIAQHGEYIEYPNYFDDPKKINKYPVFKMKKKYEDTVPCCQSIIHEVKDEPEKVDKVDKIEKVEKKAEKKTEELKTNQYIIDKLDPIDAQPGIFKYGFLPEPLRILFNLDKSVFQSSKSSVPQELLRWGVPNRQYTFLSTMHIIYNYIHQQNQVNYKDYLQLFRLEFPYVQNGNIIQKYKKFKYFLDDIDNITHEDAWDFVAQVNKVNIVIFKHNVNFVEIVCPSNMYDPKKIKNQKFIMLYYQYFEGKHCYEPIIQKPQSKNDISFLFDIKNEYVKNVLDIIKEKYTNNCNSINDYVIEDKFHPSQAMISTELYDKLYEIYENIQQVVHYEKCIGFIINNFFIPCYPSQVIVDMDKVKKPTINTVKSTIDFLNEINKLDVNCRPIYKVISENNIIGILLETFQYVPCIPMKNTSYIKLASYYENLQYEYNTFNTTTNDVMRLQNTNKIKYEQYSYIYLKNRMMNELNLHNNVKNRKQIKQIFNSKDGYQTKLIKITAIIQSILDSLDMIEWIDTITDEYIHLFITQCPNGFCQTMDKIYLSKINLVTHEKNDYPKKLADEILRNKQVELFVLKPEIQFSIPSQLNENELILDKNILKTYLQNLDKPYHYSRTYDNAQIRKPEQIKILSFYAKKLTWKVIITE
jgi:hypothetical protein